MAFVLLGKSRTANADGTLSVIVAIDGSLAFRIEHSVPSATGDIPAWLETFAAPASKQRLAWIAVTQAANYTPAVVPEDWLHETLPKARIPRLTHAILELVIDELNTLRALHSLPDRTLTQAREAVRGKLNA